MSMKTWTEQGYGFEIGNNIEKIAGFLRDHCGLGEDEYNEILKCENTEDMWCICEINVESCIADAINKENGLTVVCGYSIDEYDTPAMIGINPSLPWQMNDADKALTVEKVDELFAHYKELLGADMERENDDFEMSYFG